MSTVDLLRAQWHRSCTRLLERVNGLTDEEYRWEPVADCWNVRPDPAAPGGWTVDYPDVAPDPPPFTTIAWRLVHISDGNSIYWEHAFGPGVRTYADLAPHGDAAGAVAYLAESQRPVTTTLATLHDDELEEVRSTPLGDRRTVRQILATLVDEQVHHGAEVGVLRDLYRERSRRG